MNAILFDTLKFADRLKQAGFNEKQAEGAAEALDEALTGSVASKGDLDTLGAKLDVRISEVSARIDSKLSETVRWVIGTGVLNLFATAATVLGALKLAGVLK